jgi:septal ring factor EnvC (AmiA/AmiB activator)
MSGFVRADDGLRPRGSDVDPLELSAKVTGDDRSLAAIQKDEQSARAELEALKGQDEASRRRLLLRGRAMYRLVRVGILPAGGGFASLIEHAIKMERARRALDQDMAAYRTMGERKLALTRKIDELDKRRAPLEIERDAAQRARALLGEAEDRRRSFERAFQTSTGAGDYVAIYGGGLGGLSGPDGPAPSGGEGFRSMKGTLPFPVSGRTEIRNVRRPGASGPALEMAAPFGAPVHAVFAGRVAFADRYDPFGQIVILDHGDHYFTLMGDLATIDVRVGDDLSAGAKVGTVGSGSSDEGTSGYVSPRRAPSLYFEIRHGQSTLDPGPWLGL